MMTRHYAILIMFVIAAFEGCLPASRVTHSSNRSSGDANTLHTAGAAAGLSTERRQILISAEQWLGSPYSYGGSSKSGTDCSGFVRSVFQDIHVTLPRTSIEQSNVGSTIGLNRAVAGDLFFFNTTGEGVSHVGIAIGNDKFIHASTSQGVIVSSLQEKYYGEKFLFAKRVL